MGPVLASQARSRLTNFDAIRPNHATRALTAVSGSPELSSPAAPRAIAHQRAAETCPGRSTRAPTGTTLAQFYRTAASRFTPDKPAYSRFIPPNWHVKSAATEKVDRTDEQSPARHPLDRISALSKSEKRNEP